MQTHTRAAMKRIIVGVDGSSPEPSACRSRPLSDARLLLGSVSNQVVHHSVCSVVVVRGPSLSPGHRAKEPIVDLHRRIRQTLEAYLRPAYCRPV